MLLQIFHNTSATVDADTTDDDNYDGWNENTGVLTLVHDDKPVRIKKAVILTVHLYGTIIVFGKIFQ